MMTPKDEVEQEMHFCTLGMFILDTIDFPPPTPSVSNIPGGAGTYSLLGARFFSPPPLSRSVGCVVDCGYDFPEQVRGEIASWQSGAVMREDAARQTTGGWNGYEGEGEVRAFHYTTPKRRITHLDLVNTPLLHAKSFHLICAPARAIELVQGIMELRSQDPLTTTTARPLFIWEPVPDLCVPEELERCVEALKWVDVVSPNHSELGGFFGRSTEDGEHVNYRLIEELCGKWLESGIGLTGSGGVVLRSGKDGCLVAQRGGSKWLPAYHQDSGKVVDPTGGGNGFLGGLAVGLVREGELTEAAAWGAVAASFAIEQVGMPRLGSSERGETWNGVYVEERLAEYKQRVGVYVQP